MIAIGEILRGGEVSRSKGGRIERERIFEGRDSSVEGKMGQDGIIK